MTKEEKIRVYSAYLPYALKIECYSNEEIEVGGNYITTLAGINQNGITDDLGNDWHFGVRPVLYPLEYLTKEIEHDGERFVPMIKLLELQETNHFSKNKVIKDSVIFDKTKIIDCESKTYDIFASVTAHNVRYLVETSNVGTLIYSLTYDEYLDRFGSRDETQNRPLGVGHQRQMFEKLYEWHFNVFQLPESEYINKATLTNK
ncbi:hypothetical protein [Chryseobacterium sp.]|uniref:hypothetical protein n=1 Tax=Chryseobacterium sp. TaxID=1871047 RepID=UPI0024E25736|nr:hypothetical protein [Chryseobacterium sp.]